MTLDTSALFAALRNEPERDEFIELMAQAPRLLISTATVLEAAMVTEGRKGLEAGLEMDLFLEKAGAEIVDFDAIQLAAARRAFRRFGKGRHPAGLNFGDCIVYALSECSGEPLLYKGQDFAATGIASARPA